MVFQYSIIFCSWKLVWTFEVASYVVGICFQCVLLQTSESCLIMRICWVIYHGFPSIYKWWQFPILWFNANTHIIGILYQIGECVLLKLRPYQVKRLQVRIVTINSRLKCDNVENTRMTYLHQHFINSQMLFMGLQVLTCHFKILFTYLMVDNCSLIFYAFTTIILLSTDLPLQMILWCCFSKLSSAFEYWNCVCQKLFENGFCQVILCLYSTFIGF